MRDFLLAAIVGLLSIIGLVKPKIGVFGYVWFALMRPDVVAFSGPSNSYSLMIAASTLLGSLLYVGRIPRLIGNPIVVGLLALQVPIAISAFTAVDPQLSVPSYWLFVRLLVMALLIPIFVESVEDLRILFLVIIVSLGFIGLKFGVYGLARGGIHNEAGYSPDTMLSGNNEVGMALAMVLPLCYYSSQLLTAHWQKLGMMVISFSTVAAIVMTYSRGAALGLAAVAFMIVKRSPRRMIAIVAIVILVAPVVYLVGTSYLDRLETIKAPTEEGSAASRIEMSKLAFRIWQDHPIFGIGYGRENFRRIAPSYGYTGSSFVVHNTYIEILVDSGIFAFLIFVGILFGTIVWLGRSARRMSAVAPKLAVYPISLQLGLLAFAVTCTFGSKENFEFYYMLLMAAAAWYRIARTVEPEELAPDEGSTIVPAFVSQP
jgi:putative inorganic carbon (HCO3(-)) transporter